MMWSNFSFRNFFNWFKPEVEVCDPPSMFYRFPSSFPPSFNPLVPSYEDSAIESGLMEDDWHCGHHSHFCSEMDFHSSTISSWDSVDISSGADDWTDFCAGSDFGFDD